MLAANHRSELRDPNEVALKKGPKKLKGVANSWEDNTLSTNQNPPKLPWSETPSFMRALRDLLIQLHM